MHAASCQRWSQLWWHGLYVQLVPIALPPGVRLATPAHAAHALAVVKTK